jgi:hypothetical protein
MELGGNIVPQEAAQDQPGVQGSFLAMYFWVSQEEHCFAEGGLASSTVIDRLSRSSVFFVCALIKQYV